MVSRAWGQHLQGRICCRCEPWAGPHRVLPRSPPGGRLTLIQVKQGQGEGWESPSGVPAVGCAGGVGEERPERGGQRLKAGDVCPWSLFSGPGSPIRYEPTIPARQDPVPPDLTGVMTTICSMIFLGQGFWFYFLPAGSPPLIVNTFPAATVWKGAVFTFHLGREVEARRSTSTGTPLPYPSHTQTRGSPQIFPKCPPPPLGSGFPREWA